MSIETSKIAELTVPERLKPGDTIAVIAPASFVDDNRIAGAKAVIESRGYQAQISANLKDSYGYLAGSCDQARADAFMNAFADQNVRGIICARGGYGTMRILPLIDWTAVRKNPKFFCGFSDITALHSALHKEAGMMTYHGGPMPRRENTIADDWNDNSFWQAAESGPSVGIVAGVPNGPPVETLVGGQATGVLEGGNLTLLAALCGTRWQIDLHGKILLVEDISEAPYRIDRSLTQMLLSGALDGVAGIVFGHSPTCERGADDEGFTLREVILDRLGIFGVPLIYGFPCGHSDFRATIPLGRTVNLDANAGTLEFA
ncbi:MAG: LD-carboxypeptidase [Candidatus Obscuribacterales bacterium]|nr:LD-carboxypeptidase [Candidatus Obscuribacterales bacterium]